MPANGAVRDARAAPFFCPLRRAGLQVSAAFEFALVRLKLAPAARPFSRVGDI